METKIIKLEHKVICDLCGVAMSAGEKCKVVTDAATNHVYFEHLRCPPEGACVPTFVPIFPALSNACAPA
jgi:hypothetical protein